MLLIVFLTAAAFTLVGYQIGCTVGFDNGFEAALECFEEEVRNVQNNNDF